MTLKLEPSTDATFIIRNDAWAQQTNDKDTLQQLQAAVSTMQRYQGQVTGMNLAV